MSDEAEEIELAEGMPLENPDGDALGRIATMLIDDEDEVAFLLVEIPSGGAPRLLPVEAVEDVQDGRLVVDLPPGSMEDLPQIEGDRDPTDAEMDLAYAVAGFGD